MDQVLVRGLGDSYFYGPRHNKNEGRRSLISLVSSPRKPTKTRNDPVYMLTSL